MHCAVVGVLLGSNVGTAVGDAVGLMEGKADGTAVGAAVGEGEVGIGDGRLTQQPQVLDVGVPLRHIPVWNCPPVAAHEAFDE